MQHYKPVQKAFEHAKEPISTRFPTPASVQCDPEVDRTHYHLQTD